MRKVLSLLLLVSTITHSQTILIGAFGESNMVSRAKDDPAHEVAVTPGAYWYKASSNTLQPLIEPVGEGISAADSRTMHPAMVKRLKELAPGYNVIIVPAAAGGTTIGAWTRGTGTLYDRAKIMWDAAIAYCSANNIVLAKKYICWQQGGNDIGDLETDGYYYYLNKLTNDFVSDFGAEKVFSIRIGYDPNYAPAAEAEKIMKAHKLVGFNNPHYIVATNEPATFTPQNGKMQFDLVHYSLLGENTCGIAVAEAIHLYQTTGTKPVLGEPVPALQSVTTGYINLNQDWTFDFSNNLLESSANVTAKHMARPWQTQPSDLYDNGALVLSGVGGVHTSRPFVSNAFALEMKFKATTTGSFSLMNGINNNSISLEYDGAGSYLSCRIDGINEVFFFPPINWSNYHTLKLTQAAGTLNVYLDGQLTGTTNSTGTLSFDWIGSGGSASTDLVGAIDYFKITVPSVTLPVGFTALRAKCINGGVELNWAAPYQSYTVQKSADGITWRDVIKTTASAYTDAKPSSFYRIVSDKISPVIRTSCSVKNIYPNPAREYVFVPEQSKIVDAAGHIVRRGKGLINIESLPAGVYVVWAAGKTEKLVIVK